MDKPMSMAVKDYIYKIMSVRTNTPQNIIEAVIKHQFDGVIEAMQKPGINTIEVSGFCKFYFNSKKALKTWVKYNKNIEAIEQELSNPGISDTRKKALELKLKGYESWRKDTKIKIDGIKSDTGRLEKQDITSPGNGGVGIPEETGDM